MFETRASARAPSLSCLTYGGAHYFHLNTYHARGDTYDDDECDNKSGSKREMLECGDVFLDKSEFCKYMLHPFQYTK